MILAQDEKVVESRNLILVGLDESWSLLPGDEVLVYAPYLSVKVDYRKHFMAWKGPFVVAKEIAPNVFELIGIEAGTPSVYYCTKLRPYVRSSDSQDRISLAPAPLKFVDGKVEYEVSEILDHWEVRGKRQYLLQ